MNEETLFHLVCEKPPDERAAYLDEACAADTALRQRLEVLLAAHEQPGSFLQSAARDNDNGEPATSAGRTVIQSGVREGPGTVIGPYKLLQQIGEGGMGVVFMAEQSQPVRRTVALKIIKPGMDSRQVIARFEAERQALAMMDHPNIARVLDAGTTASGRPYFVMELVKGVPITKHCDEHRLTPHDRLELFVHVCHAVQHAHQKGIIHRDLKPSNVLIAQYDGKPVPKVIDFGVAKAAGQQLTERTMFTGFGDVIGTPEYMSPEQAELNQLDIDTRSDVYSLGVLLYELLTGTTPIEHKRVKEAALLEVLRVIREEEPPTPSTRLSTIAELPSIAAQRGLEPKKLSGLIHGELDWIVMKALEKDRSRRYETANGFAGDIERFLQDESVLACPPSATYRFRKFARRNKGRLAAACVLAVALLVAVSGVGWAVRDRAAREEEATRERETRQAVIKERVELALEDARKRQQEGRWKEALDAAKRAEALAATGESDAETQERVREVLGDMQMLANLEIVRVRSTQNEAGFNLKDEGSGNARAFREYGIDIDALDRDEAAMRIRARTIRYELAVFLDSWSDVRRRLEQQGEKPLGKDWKELLEIARAADPDPWRDRFRKAVVTDDRQALVELAASAPISSLPAETVDRLGADLMSDSTLAEAAAFLKKGQQIHPQDFWINENLGICLVRLGQRNEAIRYLTAAVSLRPESVKGATNLGQVLASLEKSGEAVAWLNNAVELNPNSATAHFSFGKRLQDQNKLDEAIDAYSKAIEIDPKLDKIHITRGEALCQTGRFREAISDFDLATELAPDDLKAWYEAAALYLYVGDVERYRRACREMLDRFEPRAGEYAGIPEQTAKTCALAPDAVPDFARVERLAQRAVTGTQQHQWYRNYVLAKGLTDYRGGHHEQALEWLERFAPKPGGNVWDATAFVALSMTHHRLGHAEQARAALLSAGALVPKTRPAAQLFDWLHFEVLRREAEQLMGPVVPQESAVEAAAIK